MGRRVFFLLRFPAITKIVPPIRSKERRANVRYAHKCLSITSCFYPSTAVGQKQTEYYERVGFTTTDSIGGFDAHATPLLSVCNVALSP